MNEYMRLLAEGYGYEGVNFIENYMYSNLIRAFRNDVEEYGQELAEDMYITLFGEESRDLFSYMNENYEYLEEATDINSELLFEGYGEKQYLKEKIDKAAIASKAKGVGGFLKGLWSKIKGIGSGALSKLKGFVEKGLPWAKEIAKKGVSFFANNPVAQVALPAVAIAGGAAAGWKLLKKLKKGKVSDEEKQKYKEALKKNKGKAKQYVKGEKDLSFEEDIQEEVEETLTEDVMNFYIKPEEIDFDETEPITTVKAELYFETSSKDDDEVEKICKSSDFKKELEDLLKKYF